jgi:hypothetical protein
VPTRSTSYWGTHLESNGLHDLVQSLALETHWRAPVQSLA